MTKPWHPRAFRGGKRKRLRSLDEVPRSPNGRPPRRRKSGGVTLMAAGGVSAGLLIAVMTMMDWRANPPFPPGSDRENPALVRVIDGDTFDYRGERIRVADIDTPERDGQCAAERALAGRATRRMADLIDDGPFTLQPLRNRDEDQYGRKLRIVTRGGRSLGDQLVAEGLARTWSGRREPWC